MDRETANTSKIAQNHTNASGHKRVASNPNGYVMVQNNEVLSEGGGLFQ